MVFCIANILVRTLLADELRLDFYNINSE